MPKPAPGPRRPGIVHNDVDDSETLVVLFGFGGAKPKHLTKIISFYNNAGYSTIMHIPPTERVLFHSNFKVLAAEFAEEMAPIRPYSNIVYDLMSANGAQFFAQFLDYAKYNESVRYLRDNAKAIIFDSCPAYVSPHQTAFALAAIHYPPDKFPLQIYSAYIGLVSLYSLERVVAYVSSILDKKAMARYLGYYHISSLSDVLPRKQLFIYGPNDKVCSSHSIEEFINLSMKHGTEVTKMITDAPHVEHFRRYPGLYKKTCLEFLQRTFNRKHDEQRLFISKL